MLKQSFRPEFLNRLDEIVFYKPLSRDNIKDIIDLQLADLQKRLDQQQITLQLTDNAKQFIIDKAYDPIYGARPLKRFLQSHVETMLGRKIIADEIAPDSTVVLDSDGEELLFR